jgi:hypothetical protein
MLLAQTFFLSILRSWTPIPKGGPEGMAAATDGRFKASSLMPVFAFLVIVWSIGVTEFYYQPVAKKIPWKIPACLFLVLIRIGYNIAVAWDYEISPMKQKVPEAYIFALGYVPVLLIMLVMIVAAWREKNDDLVIKDIRDQRHAKMDSELGISRNVKMKPVKLPTVDSGMTVESRATANSGKSTGMMIGQEKR